LVAPQDYESATRDFRRKDRSRWFGRQESMRRCSHRARSSARSFTNHSANRCADAILPSQS